MLSLNVVAKTVVADDIIELAFSPDEGVVLPGFTAGAHIDLHLGDDLVRQYSLTNPGEAPGQYRVAVARDANSRGGSVSVHDKVRIGQKLDVSEPRNHFPLDETADQHVFVAGGIGVTPILAMIRHCEATNQNWQLIYATRSTARCAYREELASHGDKVRFHHDDQAGGPLEIATALPAPHQGTHVYCCGPEPLMHAVKDATGDWKNNHVHFEWFSADSATPEGANAEFEIVLSKSGRRFVVPADKSALEILRENGVPIASVCSEGICGTCETYVLSGEIDHRDNVLTDEEKESNEMMMVCCSRGRGEIVLDL